MFTTTMPYIVEFQIPFALRVGQEFTPRALPTERTMPDVAAHVLAIANVFVGALLLYAGAAKLLSLAKFRQDLLLIPYIPYRSSPYLAFAIPAVELVAGTGLSLAYRWAAPVAITLFGVFSLAAFVAHRRNQRVPCNCFGDDGAEYLSLRTVVKNGLLAGMVVSSMSLPNGTLDPLDVLYGLIFFLLFLASQRCITNQRELRESS